MDLGTMEQRLQSRRCELTGAAGRCWLLVAACCLLLAAVAAAAAASGCCCWLAAVCDLQDRVQLADKPCCPFGPPTLPSWQ